MSYWLWALAGVLFDLVAFGMIVGGLTGLVVKAVGGVLYRP